MSDTVRISKWDNVKCILIFLVVIGHFANEFDTSSRTMRILALFIYTFHMPLFIFMSGLLEKKQTAATPFNFRKVMFFLIIGYTLKILIFITRSAFHKHPHFRPLTDTGLPWYMFAMAAFCVILYLVRTLNQAAVLIASIIIACLAGYCTHIDSFLSLSRIIVFFPFYYLGYMVNSRTLLKLSEKKWLKVLSAAAIILGVSICALHIKTLYTYIRLLTGRNAYAFIHHGHCSFLNRLLFYIIAVVLGWAVLNLASEKQHKVLGHIGKNTLQIYFCHRLIIYVIMYTGFVDTLRSTFGNIWIPVYLFVAVLLTFLLSADMFGLPLKLLRKFSDSLCAKIFVPHHAGNHHSRRLRHASL